MVDKNAQSATCVVVQADVKPTTMAVGMARF